MGENIVNFDHSFQRSANVELATVDIYDLFMKMDPQHFMLTTKSAWSRNILDCLSKNKAFTRVGANFSYGIKQTSNICAKWVKPRRCAKSII